MDNFCKILLTRCKEKVSGLLISFPCFPFSLLPPAALCHLSSLFYWNSCCTGHQSMLNLIDTCWSLFYSTVLCHLPLWSFPLSLNSLSPRHYYLLIFLLFLSFLLICFFFFFVFNIWSVATESATNDPKINLSPLYASLCTYYWWLTPEQINCWISFLDLCPLT